MKLNSEKELNEKLEVFNVKTYDNGQVLIKAKNGDTLLLSPKKKLDENGNSYTYFTGEFLTKKENKAIEKLQGKINNIESQIEEIKNGKTDLEESEEVEIEPENNEENNENE